PQRARFWAKSRDFRRGRAGRAGRADRPGAAGRAVRAAPGPPRAVREARAARSFVADASASDRFARAEARAPRFWQFGQKNVERAPWTIRRTGVPHTRHGSPARSYTSRRSP